MFTAFLLATATLLSASPSPPSNDPTSLLAWTTFKKTFNKTYVTREENVKRMAIFLSNRKTIIKHNALYKLGRSTHYEKTNEYSDLTDEEFRKFTQKPFTIQFRVTKRSQENRSDDEYFVPSKNATALPDSVDWRKKGDNSPVERQGACGCCWAITTAASLEAAHAIKTGETVLLSVQELTDCSKERENDGCNGGWIDDAYSYVISNGLASSKAYPRPFQRRNFEDCLRGTIPASVKQKRFLRIRPGREDDLKSAVATVGPVAVSTHVEDFAWKQYRGGVLESKTCRKEFVELNHGSLCVGYGTENGTDYWLLRNTWGDGWGDDGYIKVRRNAGNQCGIATEALFPVL